MIGILIFFEFINDIIKNINATFVIKTTKNPKKFLIGDTRQLKEYIDGGVAHQLKKTSTHKSSTLAQTLASPNFIGGYINNSLPEYTIELSNPTESHSFWAVDKEEDINTIKRLFNEHISRAYIADGHHRASVTARLVKKKYLQDHDDDIHPGLLCAFFPFSDLTIYDFNRVVQLPDYMSTTRFMALLSMYFDISPAVIPTKPVKKHQLTLYINQEWYILHWKESVIGLYNERPMVLDVDLFNDYVLKNILNISDIKSATDIKYVEGVSGLDGLMAAAKNPASAAFCLFAVTKEDLIKISDAGGVLPPKSTWFEPRMKNAMIIKEF